MKYNYYNGIKDIFRQISEGHQNISAVFFGDMFELESQINREFKSFPFLYVNVLNMDLNDNTLQYRIEVGVFDVYNEKQNKDVREVIYHNTQMALIDVINVIKWDRNRTLGVNIINTPNLSQMKGEMGINVFGWFGDIILETHYNNDSGNIPYIEKNNT